MSLGCEPSYVIKIHGNWDLSQDLLAQLDGGGLSLVWQIQVMFGPKARAGGQWL